MGAFEDSLQQNTTQPENTQQNTNQENTTGDTSGTNQPVDTTDDTGGDGSDKNNTGGANEQLLQSASVDLDADGANEVIEVVGITTVIPESDGGYQSIAGQIKIRDGEQEKRIPFWEKNDGSTGLISGMKFEDLDGDGATDVFITIPDSGAAFSYSNYFIYSYKKDLSYTLTSDRKLYEFISDFSFKNAGNQNLNITNSRYDLSANLHIELDVGQDEIEDFMNDYERQAWIEPVSIDISEDSKISLVRDDKGKPVIKVPLPIFGLGTINMIGEIDLYYSIDESFNPVLKKFEIIDFDGMDRKLAGYCVIE